MLVPTACLRGLRFAFREALKGEVLLCNSQLPNDFYEEFFFLLCRSFMSLIFQYCAFHETKRE